VVNHTYIHNNQFQLESGEILPLLTINYSTLGTLNPEKNNVVWVCHALTANADVSAWWSGLVGEGKFYNPKDHFIICANILGSCYGSTGPLSVNPHTGKPYYLSFPQTTIRDMVKAHEILRMHLGIQKIHTCIGGSLGGQQAMEWAIMNPDLIGQLILLATNAMHSPWGIAFNEAQRMAIKADPTWTEENEHAGRQGLKAARAVALLSYRNYHTYLNSQHESDLDKTDHFKASSYQNYQGEKLVNRFNCHSYLFLSKSMDSHNVGRGRTSLKNALSRLRSNTLMIGITSDLLFPVSEQLFLKEHISNACYDEIDSIYGHDGFLIETVKIERIIHSFYTQLKATSKTV
jgi:homoserine O-acetyltransferase